jgi:glycosyltransferase A (GT-A) superfamily protein (DUF2064 family)
VSPAGTEHPAEHPGDGPAEPPGERPVRGVILLLVPEAELPPPGVAVPAWREALASDTADVLASMAGVRVAVAAPPDQHTLARQVSWPGTAVLTAATPGDALAEAASLGWAQAAVLASDVPDLPGVLVAKLFRSLGSYPVTAAPAEGGGLVGLAARLPAPDWLRAPTTSLDTSTVDGLRKASGRPRQVGRTSGWHRLRTAADLSRLDPGLEGWEATRALLSGRPL